MSWSLVLVVSWFLLLPALLGVNGYYRSRVNYLRLVRRARPFANKLSLSDAESLVASIFWIAVVILYVLAVFMFLGFKSVRIVGVGLLVFCSVVPMVLFVIKFKVVQFVRENYTWLKWVAGVVAIGVTVFANVLADELIVEATHSRAENFPVSQRVLTVAGALLVYYYLLMFVALAISFAQLAYVMAKELTSGQFAQNYLRALRVVFHQRPSKRVAGKINNHVDVALITGLIILVFGLLRYAELNFNKESMAKGSQRIIVFSSFHARPEDCGLQKNEKASVSILPLGKMIVATKLENGTYDFSGGVCKDTEVKGTL